MHRYIYLYLYACGHLFIMELVLYIHHFSYIEVLAASRKTMPLRYRSDPCDRFIGEESEFISLISEEKSRDIMLKTGKLLH